MLTSPAVMTWVGLLMESAQMCFAAFVTQAREGDMLDMLLHEGRTRLAYQLPDIRTETDGNTTAKAFTAIGTAAAQPSNCSQATSRKPYFASFLLESRQAAVDDSECTSPAFVAADMPCLQMGLWGKSRLKVQKDSAAE